MSFLPRHSTIRFRPLSTVETLVAFLTDYQELALATSSWDISVVFFRLQGEWGSVGKMVRFMWSASSGYCPDSSV